VRQRERSETETHDFPVDHRWVGADDAG
jgi:hypothetical protein